jgi:hypothetical protein
VSAPRGWRIAATDRSDGLVIWRQE